MRLFIIFATAASFPSVTLAEPFLAVETGFQCGQCHTNPTGGGMRNAFGSAFSQTQLPANASTQNMEILGAIGERVNIGVDARGTGRQIENDAVDNALDFVTDRVSIYLSAKLNESVMLYVDEQIAPGGAINRESWASFSFDGGYVKVGRIFQPYGIRLEDDSANIRQLTHINFNTPDTGIELGHVGEALTAQLAITNGTGGAGEIDDGKQLTLRVAWVQPAWRLGLSASDNNTDSTDRTLYGAFAGLVTGPVSWLAEYDRIDDETPGIAGARQDLAFIEANWKIIQGHYLKFGFESRSSPGDEFMDSNRYSLEYQWFPIPFTHLRAGIRVNDSDDPNPFLNEEEGFVQLHVYF